MPCPLRICYNTAINACAQSGEWEIALGLSDEMRLSVLGEGARPDVFTFNSIMHGMAGAGECERLLSVLDEMQAAGVSPDVVSYNTAMGALNKVRRINSESQQEQGLGLDWQPPLYWHVFYKDSTWLRSRNRRTGRSCPFRQILGSQLADEAQAARGGMTPASGLI